MDAELLLNIKEEEEEEGALADKVKCLIQSWLIKKKKIDSQKTTHI